MKLYHRLSLALGTFMIGASRASAQLVDTTKMSEFTGNVQTSAGFSDTSLGYVIASILAGFMGLLAATFIVLTVVAGFRWMNSGGNEETIKKSQETIKNSLIGLILVLAAWAITYYLFKVLPFGAPSGGGIQAV